MKGKDGLGRGWTRTGHEQLGGLKHAGTGRRADGTTDQPGVNTRGLRQEAAERHVCGSAPAPRTGASPLRLRGAT